MTDPNPPVTEVDEIIVTGQRARGPSPYADLQYPTKGVGSGSGEHQEEVGDGGLGGGGQLSDEQEQCGDPEGRRQWNADARAQQAIIDFLNRADEFDEDHLQNREFGALICDMGGGSIVLGPVQDGPPILDENDQQISYPNGRPHVEIPTAGCGGGRVVGYIHSHPGNNTGIPSSNDFAYARWHVENNGAPGNIGIYVVTQFRNPQTNAYEYRVARAELSD